MESKKLTQNDIRKEKFCLAIHEGLSQRKAYLKAYPTAKKWAVRTVDNSASKLYNTNDITARLKELLEVTQEESILTAKEKRKILSNLAKEAKPTDAIKAIDVLNKMDGDYKKDNKQKKTEIHIPTHEERYG